MVFDMLLGGAEVLFLIGFLVHNFEEGMRLPDWSARRSDWIDGFLSRRLSRLPGTWVQRLFGGGYVLEASLFHRALYLVSFVGVALTFLEIRTASASIVVHHLYLGFVALVVLNVFLPHLVLSVIRREPAPGLFSGLGLNLPFGVLVFCKAGFKTFSIWLFFASLAVLVLVFAGLQVGLRGLRFRQKRGCH